MSLTLDTNILFYAADVSSGERHDVALDLVARAAKADSVLTLQCLAEFYASITRKGTLAPDEAADHIKRWQVVFPVHPASEDCLSDAMWAASEHQLSFWDAMLWATVKNAGCRLLITEDFQDGQMIDGVTFVNPFNAGNATLLNAVLPPVP